jgi:hypothetical protein
VPTDMGQNLETPVVSPPRPRIGQMIWSWLVIGGVVFFLLTDGVAFMTTGHPTLASIFYLLGAVLFLVKFLTWEETKRASGDKRTFVSLLAIVGTVVLTAAALWGTVKLNPSVPQVSASSNQLVKTQSTATVPSVPPIGICYAILMGQGNGDSIPVMTENPTAVPVDDVTMQFERQIYGDESEIEPFHGELDGELTVGTCRAHLSLGWPAFFLKPGIHSRLRYQITILSRYETFRELLTLRQEEGRPNVYCQDVQVFRNWNHLVYEHEDVDCH